MTEYDESKTKVEITKGSPVSRTCRKCGKNLVDGDTHVCVICRTAAAAGRGVETPAIDGNKDKKKPEQTED